MTRGLNFPNPSRSYDQKGHGVRFWGYDKTIEVSFFIEEGALAKIHSAISRDEAGFLNAFDVNCDRIREVAGNVYSLRRRAFYALTAADF